MAEHLFSKENQPKGRGKAFKTKLMEALREESLLDLAPSSSAEKAEKAFLSHAARRALDPEDKDNATILKVLVDKSYSSLKATMPEIEFEFDQEATPAQQVSQIIDAASKGLIAPDVANLFVSTIKAAVDIEAATDLKARIEELERLINAQG